MYTLNINYFECANSKEFSVDIEIM